jgi:hypothetical protein
MVKKEISFKLGMVVHAIMPAPQEAEGGLRVKTGLGFYKDFRPVYST